MSKSALKASKTLLSPHCSFLTTLFEQLEKSSQCSEQNTTGCHRVPLLVSLCTKKEEEQTCIHWLKLNPLTKDKNEYSQEDCASFIFFDDNLNAQQSSFEIPNVPMYLT